MKKEQKKYLVIATLHRLSDCNPDQVIGKKEYYRYGVSEKQVIARLKRIEDLKSFDNDDGSVSYEWRLEVKEIDPKTGKPKSGYEQLNLFDIEY